MTVEEGRGTLIFSVLSLLFGVVVCHFSQFLSFSQALN